MFTDSHCHLYKQYFDNLDQILKLAEQNKVHRYINNGCDNLSNKEVLELVAKYENMYATLGIHPEYVDTYEKEDIDFIKLSLSSNKVIAIGEIGLDYHYTKDNKEAQIKLFELQLQIAEDNNLPVVIHSREATFDTISILKRYKVKGVIHSFSGSIETAKEYIKMGYLIGVHGVITFKNSNLKDVIKQIGLEHIVLETDSPYLTPEPYRGKKNDPSHILDIANYICNLKGVTLQELSNITNSNLEKMFKI